MYPPTPPPSFLHLQCSCPEGGRGGDSGGALWYTYSLRKPTSSLSQEPIIDQLLHTLDIASAVSAITHLKGITKEAICLLLITMSLEKSGRGRVHVTQVGGGSHSQVGGGLYKAVIRRRIRYGGCSVCNHTSVQLAGTCMIHAQIKLYR